MSSNERYIFSNRVSQGKSLRAIALLLIGLLCGTTAQAIEALTSAFDYQGELQLQGLPAEGLFDLQFRLYDAAIGGEQIGNSVNRLATPVESGRFRVSLDFGPAQFLGERQWLEIWLRPAGQGPLHALSPRSELQATPRAWAAAEALAGSVLSASIVPGSLGAAAFDDSTVQRRISGSCSEGSGLKSVAADGSVACVELNSSVGTVTQVNTGTGLSGGPITTSGTISVADNGIGLTEINTLEVQARISGSCPDGQWMRSISVSGDVECAADEPGPARWQRSGNSGTQSGSHFVGTTDDAAMVLAVRNAPVLRMSVGLLGFLEPAVANVIGGSPGNALGPSVRGATIAGGGVTDLNADPEYPNDGPNLALSPYATVGGGLENHAGTNLSTGSGATVAGGRGNRAGGTYSTILGGLGNRITALSSTIGGGRDNTVSGSFSTIGGGRDNEVSGLRSVISGGRANCNGGNFSWVGGRNARIPPATDPGTGTCSESSFFPGQAVNGSFLWADANEGSVTSSEDHSFVVVVANGAVITGDSSVNDAGSGVALRVDGLMRVSQNGTSANIPVCINSGNRLSTCSSSQRYKHAIEDLPPSLEQVHTLRPVQFRWNDTGREDIGLIAEEVAQIDPRLVEWNSDGQIEGVRYQRLNTLLVRAVQELSEREQRLVESLAELENSRSQLRAELLELLASRTGDLP